MAITKEVESDAGTHDRGTGLNEGPGKELLRVHRIALRLVFRKQFKAFAVGFHGGRSAESEAIIQSRPVIMFGDIDSGWIEVSYVLQSIAKVEVVKSEPEYPCKLDAMSLREIRAQGIRPMNTAKLKIESSKRVSLVPASDIDHSIVMSLFWGRQ